MRKITSLYILWVLLIKLSDGAAIAPTVATSANTGESSTFFWKAINGLGSSVILYSSYLIGKNKYEEEKKDSVVYTSSTTTMTIKPTATRVYEAIHTFQGGYLAGGVPVRINGAPIEPQPIPAGQVFTTTLFPAQQEQSQEASLSESYVPLTIQLPKQVSADQNSYNLPSNITIDIACPLVRHTGSIHPICNGSPLESASEFFPLQTYAPVYRSMDMISSDTSPSVNSSKPAMDAVINDNAGYYNNTLGIQNAQVIVETVVVPETPTTIERAAAAEAPVVVTIDAMGNQIYAATPQPVIVTQPAVATQPVIISYVTAAAPEPIQQQQVPVAQVQAGSQTQGQVIIVETVAAPAAVQQYTYVQQANSPAAPETHMATPMVVTVSQQAQPPAQAEGQSSEPQYQVVVTSSYPVAPATQPIYTQPEVIQVAGTSLEAGYPSAAAPAVSSPHVVAVPKVVASSPISYTPGTSQVVYQSQPLQNQYQVSGSSPGAGASGSVQYVSPNSVPQVATSVTY
ncbi:hypothetical protein DASC09_033000 [Saccharomycopsis crataegensis]|uniref:Uncharacterized protein n=1 Tax=Saccharomycopsis crataegensis TaxID=43959 RepID=A0AAV5QNS9_9ASCO|nr:hypothetical protein DASC09_033000 [Saccharomycopsis crataegensis]